MHRGFFRGVDDAERVRDEIRARVDAHRDAGLGDPDEPEGSADAAAVDAARMLLEEVRLLRGAL